MKEIIPDKVTQGHPNWGFIALFCVLVLPLFALVAIKQGWFGYADEISAESTTTRVPVSPVAGESPDPVLRDLQSYTVRQLEDFSMRGIASASFELGERYRLGKGSIRDAVEANRCYDKAMLVANPDTMFRLAAVFESLGRAEESMMLFEKAAIWGVPDAQLQTAFLHYKTAPNGVETYAWFSLCASIGHSSAIFHRDRIENGMSLMELRHGRALGREINGKVALSRIIMSGKASLAELRRRALDGDHAAEVELGDFHYWGREGGRNESSALSFYKVAADAGFVPAYARLAHFYEFSDYKDVSLSRAYYLKGAFAGDSFCQRLLAINCLHGMGPFLESKVDAYAWLNIAAASGDNESITMLDALELQMDQDLVVSAQKRTRELLAEIEAKKAKK
jgi:TPR repeat protein